MPTCALSGRPPQLQDESNLFLDKNVQAQIVFSLLTLIIQGGGSAPWQGMDHQCSRVLRQPRVLQKNLCPLLTCIPALILKSLHGDLSKWKCVDAISTWLDGNLVIIVPSTCYQPILMHGKRQEGQTQCTIKVV